MKTPEANTLAQSTTRRSAVRINREVELLGGELSAYHSRENLVLRAKFLREDLAYFAEVLAEVISKTRYAREYRWPASIEPRLTFVTAHELNEEVSRIMRLGQKNLLANPSHMAINSAHGLAFHRGLGTPLYPTSSTTFTKYLEPEEIYNFATSAYSKSNIAVVANGTSQAELSKWVREFFENTYTEGKKLESPATKYYGGEERIAHDKGNVMILAFPGTSSFTSGSAHRPEIAVLATLLGGESTIKWSPGFSLLAKAASQHQHAHVSTQNLGYSDAGLLAVTLSGNASHIAKASRSVVEALEKVASGNVSSEDIKKATALAKFRALEIGQDINAGLEATGSGLISGGRAYQIDEIAQSIEKVGEDKVKAVSLTA
jgi:ubiquinol-cytochrome c reductase core subunit 2